MDEPLAGLDTPRRAEIMPFIESLRDRLGVPIVYVTHNIDEIIRLADTVVLIDEGRVAAAEPLEEIMTRLDLSAIIGSFDAGAVMRATVAEHDIEHALTRLTIEGGALSVSRIELSVGAQLRVRIRARDVILALNRPADISTLNVLRGTVTELRPAMASQTDVLVDVGSRLWARVTRRSVEELGLAPGREVYALVKSVALDHYAAGFGDDVS
jgi:molybdate transport system ATP-binding protein